MNSIKEKSMTIKKKKDKLAYWNDFLIQDFYLDYYQNLDSNDLDKEFNKDIKILAKALNKLPASARKAFIEVFARYIEFYIENKIEKEIDSSLEKILKL
ncbi:MAG: hypothetical protein GXO75_07510 [Calditrichaeota bacterium]|nr:hypothetical protein [Calditrichota bacterium]